jgi:hypothetical protein
MKHPTCKGATQTTQEKKHRSLPYDDALGEPLDGRDSQPSELGDQDYPETLDAGDPLRHDSRSLADRGMHVESDGELGYMETRAGLRDEERDVP